MPNWPIRLAASPRFLRSVRGELVEKRLGAGAGDGAERLDEILAAHADAVVDEGQRLGLRIERDADREGLAVGDQFGLGDATRSAAFRRRRRRWRRVRARRCRARNRPNAPSDAAGAKRQLRSSGFSRRRPLRAPWRLQSSRRPLGFDLKARASTRAHIARDSRLSRRAGARRTNKRRTDWEGARRSAGLRGLVGFATVRGLGGKFAGQTIEPRLRGSTLFSPIPAASG